MVVKIGLENTADLRWVAILLDKSPPQMEPSPADPNTSLPATAGGFDGGEGETSRDGAEDGKPDDAEVA
jgi:hypothetical protein